MANMLRRVYLAQDVFGKLSSKKVTYIDVYFVETKG